MFGSTSESAAGHSSSPGHSRCFLQNPAGDRPGGSTPYDGRRPLADPRDEAALLAQLVRLGRSVSIIEIGASYGFSTLHLAAAALENGGHVHTLEQDPKKVAATTKHLDEAGLIGVTTIYPGDARATLKTMKPGRRSISSSSMPRRASRSSTSRPSGRSCGADRHARDR